MIPAKPPVSSREPSWRQSCPLSITAQLWRREIGARIGGREDHSKQRQDEATTRLAGRWDLGPTIGSVAVWPVWPVWPVWRGGLRRYKCEVR